MRRVAWATALAVFGTPACASKNVVAEGPVSAIEITEDGDKKPIPNAGVTEIDVNSSIELRVDAAAAQKELANAVNVDAGRIAALNSQIREIRRVTAVQKKATERLTELLKTPPEPAKRRQVLLEVGGLEKQALDRLQSDATRARINELLLTKRPVGEITLEVLVERNAKLQEELDALTAKLERVRWRMQATLLRSGGPEFIHLEGYDELPQGTARIIDKLALPSNLLSTIDQARVAAAEIQTLKDLRAHLRDLVHKRAEEFRDRFVRVADNLKEIPEIAARVEKVPWGASKRGKSAIAAVKQLAADVQTVIEPCRLGLEQIELLRNATPAEIATALAGSGSSVRSCVETIATKAAVIAKDAKQVAEKSEGLKQAAASDPALAQATTARAQADVETLVTRTKGAAVSEFAAWWSSVSVTFDRSWSAGEDPSFAPPDRTTDRAYRELKDTTIDLVRTSREQGDIVYYRAAVVTDGTETAQWTSAPLRVVTAGLHVDVSASVVFVRAIDKQAGDSSFPAAPAATAAMHYRAPRAAGTNRSGSLWNFINPGLGLHLAYLDLGPETHGGETPSDPSTELGVGGTMQLFGDVLQGGVAYDLQVERPYLFFGVGVQTLTSFGLTIPAGGK